MPLQPGVRAGCGPRGTGLAHTVLPGLGTRPFLEGPVKGTGLLESQALRNFGYPQRAVAQVVDGRIAPELVLDALVARAFGFQPPPQRGRRHMETARHVVQQRPVRTVGAAQAPPQPGRPAVLVLVLEKNRLWCAAQERANGVGVLHDRRIQQAGIEPDRGAGGIEVQVVGIHHRVFGRVGWAWPGEIHLRERHPPPDQPAQQAMQHHQIGFIGKTPGRWIGNLVVDAHHGLPVFQHQFATDIVQKQREAAQAAPHGTVQAAGAQRRLAQQRETPDLHAPVIEPEELVVQLTRHGQPQVGKCPRWHPRRRQRQQLRLDAGHLQHPRPCGTGQAGHGGVDEIHGDSVFLHGGGWCLLSLSAGGRCVSGKWQKRQPDWLLWLSPAAGKGRTVRRWACRITFRPGWRSTAATARPRFPRRPP